MATETMDRVDTVTLWSGPADGMVIPFPSSKLIRIPLGRKPGVRMSYVGGEVYTPPVWTRDEHVPETVANYEYRAETKRFEWVAPFGGKMNRNIK